MNEDELLTVQQVATALGINRVTVYDAMREGRLPYVEIIGHRAIKRADAEAYKERTRVSGEKPKGRPKGSANRKKEAGGIEAEIFDQVKTE